MQFKKIILCAITSIFVTSSSLISASAYPQSNHSDYASDNTTTIYDLKTGEITIEEYSQEIMAKTFSDLIIEPYIPDGMEQNVTFADDSGISPFVVIGDDTREQMHDVNTFPNSAVCFMEMVFPDNNYTGSGTLIGRRTVLTAAHNVRHNDGVMVQSVRITPGGTGANFGTFDVARIVLNDAGNNDIVNDYALLILDTDIGRTTGSFGVTSYQDVSSLMQQNVFQYGYPGDKPRGTLWRGLGLINLINGDVNGGEIHYDADIKGGQSGGTVVLTSKPTYVVGVHSKGVSLLSDGTPLYNAASRMSTYVVVWIVNNMNRN